MDNFSDISNFSCPNVRSTLFGLYTGVLLLFCVASIGLTILLMKLIPAHGLYHANVRLTLQNFCATNLLTSILLLIHGIKGLSLLTFGYEVIQLSTVICMALNEFRNTINTVALVSMSVIGFERLVATLRQKYLDPENASRTMKLSLALVWSGALTNGAVTVYKHASDKTIKICYCYMTSSSNLSAIVIGFIPYFVIETATITCFLLVLYFNKRLSSSIMNVSKHSLQARYIIWNNIATTRSLLPTVITNSVMYSFILGMQFVMKMTHANNEIGPAIVSWSVTFVLVSFGSLVDSFLLAKFNRKLELAVKRIMKRFFKVVNYCFKINNQVEPINRTVVSYKVRPEQSHVILNEIWTKNPLAKKGRGEDKEMRWK